MDGDTCFKPYLINYYIERPHDAHDPKVRLYLARVAGYSRGRVLPGTAGLSGRCRVVAGLGCRVAGARAQEIAYCLERDLRSRREEGRRALIRSSGMRHMRTMASALATLCSQEEEPHARRSAPPRRTPDAGDSTNYFVKM